jgi:YHS domain-containing protein
MVLAVVVVAGCKNKKDEHAGHGHGEHEASSHESGEKSAAANAQTTCPVMGGKIVKSIYADHMGKRVYLCCEGCIDTFNKDPMKYIKQLEDAGVVLEKAPSGSAHKSM